MGPRPIKGNELAFDVECEITFTCEMMDQSGENFVWRNGVIERFFESFIQPQSKYDIRHLLL